MFNFLAFLGNFRWGRFLLSQQSRCCRAARSFFALKKWYADMQDTLGNTAGTLKKINEHQLSIEMCVCGRYGSSPKRVILRAVAAEPCSIRGSKAGAAWGNLRFPHLSMYTGMVLIIDVSNTIYTNMCVTYICIRCIYICKRSHVYATKQDIPDSHGSMRTFEHGALTTAIMGGKNTYCKLTVSRNPVLCPTIIIFW